MIYSLMSAYQTSEFGMGHSNKDDVLKSQFDDLFEKFFEIEGVGIQTTIFGSFSCDCSCGSCICITDTQ